MRLAIGPAERRSVVLITLLAGAVASALVLAAGAPLMQSDSAGYINWLPERTPGYPLFLAAIAWITPDYRALPLAQSALFVAATAFFCDALAVALRSRLAGIAVALAILGNPFLMRAMGIIMSEALYLTLVLAHFGCVLRSLEDRRWRWAGLAGATLGLAILVRPVGYALLFGAPWLVLAWREARLARTALFGAAIAVLVLGASTGNLVFRGYFATQAFGGINLILHVATLAPPELEGFDPAVTRATYDGLAPVRELENRTTGWERRTIVWMLTYNLKWSILAPAQAAAAAGEAVWRTASPHWRPIAVNALATDFAKKAVRADFRGYCDIVAHQLYGLWFYAALTDRATADAVADLIKDRPGWDRAGFIDANLKIVPAPVYWAKLALFGALLLIMLGAAAAPLLGRPLGALGYFAATSFCYCGVVALVEAGLPRYSMMIWPAQCAVAAATLLYLAARWRAWRRRRGPAC